MVRITRLGSLRILDEETSPTRSYVLERVGVMRGVLDRFAQRVRANRDALTYTLRSRAAQLRADFDALPDMATAREAYITYQAAAALNTISRTYNALERAVDDAIARAAAVPAPPPAPPSPLPSPAPVPVAPKPSPSPLTPAGPVRSSGVLVAVGAVGVAAAALWAVWVLRG